MTRITDVFLTLTLSGVLAGVVYAQSTNGADGTTGAKTGGTPNKGPGFDDAKNNPGAPSSTGGTGGGAAGGSAGGAQKHKHKKNDGATGSTGAGGSTDGTR